MGIEPSGHQQFFEPTIVRRLVGLHKGVRRAAIACGLGLWIPFSAGWAQSQSTAQIVGVSDVAAVVGGAALFAAPHLLHVNAGPPECAPCDPANVPWFDRWVIATPARAGTRRVISRSSESQGGGLGGSRAPGGRRGGWSGRVHCVCRFGCRSYGTRQGSGRPQPAGVVHRWRTGSRPAPRQSALVAVRAHRCGVCPGNQPLAQPLPPW